MWPIALSTIHFNNQFYFAFVGRIVCPQQSGKQRKLYARSESHEVNVFKVNRMNL